jgi:hypothetical protein
MKLFEICSDLETISARDLGEMGSTHLRRLSTELAVVEDALQNWEAKGMAKH